MPYPSIVKRIAVFCRSHSATVTVDVNGSHLGFLRSMALDFLQADGRLWYSAQVLSIQQTVAADAQRGGDAHEGVVLLVGSLRLTLKHVNEGLPERWSHCQVRYGGIFAVPGAAATQRVRREVRKDPPLQKMQARFSSMTPLEMAQTAFYCSLMGDETDAALNNLRDAMSYQEDVPLHHRDRGSLFSDYRCAADQMMVLYNMDEVYMHLYTV